MKVMDYLTPAPYLVGVLGVPEHPRNLGVQKGAKPDFCLSEFCYYYEHPRIKKAKYGSDIGTLSPVLAYLVWHIP